jgi:hypothetical protein
VPEIVLPIDNRSVTIDDIITAHEHQCEWVERNRSVISL